MAFKISDRADIYMATEAAMGPDSGQNGFAWQVEGMIGGGTRNLRTYYVIVQTLSATPVAPFTVAKPFGTVVVTILPGQPRHSAVLPANAAATYATQDAAVTALGAQILAAGGTETSVYGGVLAALNS